MREMEPAIFFELPIPPEPDRRIVEREKDVVEFIANYIWNKAEIYDFTGPSGVFYGEFKQIVKKNQSKIRRWLRMECSWEKLIEQIYYDFAEFLRLKAISEQPYYS
ncbi:hypothetical protein [Palaeococcus pacificus]|nr:hypothetical protein [Palaeococcus pacificus]